MGAPICAGPEAVGARPMRALCDPVPAHKLSAEERTQGLALCQEPAYACLPPRQIVPRWADQGEYLASEATFYRILRPMSYTSAAVAARYARGASCRDG